HDLRAERGPRGATVVLPHDRRDREAPHDRVQAGRHRRDHVPADGDGLPARPRAGDPAPDPPNVTRAVNTRAGRVVIVMRHPRTGREAKAFGGSARFRGTDVLDIGTGNGRLAFDVARYARHVTGLDPSEGAIEIARRRADAQGVLNVDFRVGSAGELDA